jgi:formyltetrahydrofolate-dependent phosphoribosylglycinamide formyltransferase
MSHTPCRVAVLLSGAGSTFVNLHDHIQRGDLDAEIAVVVSSRTDALGLERAKERGLPCHTLGRKAFSRGCQFDVSAYSHALAELIAPYAPRLVVLAGFMTQLGAPLLDRYDTMNVHPALLPDFGGEGCYGHHVHEAVLASGRAVSGATVHFVDAQYDHGPIVLQESVPVLPDDTADTLAARVQAAERRIYPAAVALYAAGRLLREGGGVRILGQVDK